LSAVGDVLLSYRSYTASERVNIAQGSRAMAHASADCAADANTDCSSIVCRFAVHVRGAHVAVHVLSTRLVVALGEHVCERRAGVAAPNGPVAVALSAVSARGIASHGRVSCRGGDHAHLL